MGGVRVVRIQIYSEEESLKMYNRKRKVVINEERQDKVVFRKGRFQELGFEDDKSEMSFRHAMVNPDWVRGWRCTFGGPLHADPIKT